MSESINSLDHLLQEALGATSPNKCACHVINPRIHRVLLWANVNKETGEVEYTLRIGSQRFTSLANTDKGGQTYWRFQSAGFFADGNETINPPTN